MLVEATDGSTADVTDQVTWLSQRTGVATIDAHGVATGVAAGETEIHAADRTSGASAATPATLTVVKLSGLSLSPPSGGVRAGRIPCASQRVAGRLGRGGRRTDDE